MPSDNPNNEETRWKPGESGNPAGRPKGRFSITSQIIKLLEEDPEKNKELIEWLFANKKDKVWDKIDPNPPVDINLGSNGELPFTIKIIKDDGESSNTI